jgi:hypothetical protein
VLSAAACLWFFFLTSQTKKPSKPINARAIGSPTPRPTPRPILKDPESAEGVDEVDCATVCEADVVAVRDDVLPNDDELVLTADVEVDIGFRIMVPTGTLTQADFEQQSTASGWQQ